MLDNNDFYDMHQAKQDKWLEARPRCCCCGEPIQDDMLYDIDGDLYCEDCMNDEFRHSTDNYIQ